MVDRPILFSGSMVRALLDGRKTQTRRVLNPQPEPDFIAATFDAQGFVLRPAMLAFGSTAMMLGRLPRIGDRLWVRETWSHTGDGVFEIWQARIAPTGRVIFAATPAPDAPHAKHWPSIHMPREFSRLTLAVTDVRVERLQDISEADAIAEGIDCIDEPAGEFAGSWSMYADEPNDGIGGAWSSAARSYGSLWDGLNAKRGYSWDANPWVCAITFTVHHQNIDALGAMEAA